jgi:hypothetical protein
MVENDFAFPFDSLSMSGANLGGGDDGYVSQNDMEQEEEEDEIDTDWIFGWYRRGLQCLRELGTAGSTMTIVSYFC